MLSYVSNSVFLYGEPNPLSKGGNHKIGIAETFRGDAEFVYQKKHP